MNLLSDVLLDRNRRNFDRLDARERKEVRDLESFRLPPKSVRESDVDRYLLEEPRREFRAHAVTDRAAILLLGYLT